jgi:hypothetical protein
VPWPVPESLLLEFVAQHLWNPVKRAEDPGHGMPAGGRGWIARPGAAEVLRLVCAGYGTPPPDILVDLDAPARLVGAF